MQYCRTYSAMYRCVTTSRSNTLRTCCSGCPIPLVATLRMSTACCSPAGQMCKCMYTVILCCTNHLYSVLCMLSLTCAATRCTCISAVQFKAIKVQVMYDLFKPCCHNSGVKGDLRYLSQVGTRTSSQIVRLAMNCRWSPPRHSSGLWELCCTL